MKFVRPTLDDDLEYEYIVSLPPIINNVRIDRAVSGLHLWRVWIDLYLVDRTEVCIMGLVAKFVGSTSITLLEQSRRNSQPIRLGRVLIQDRDHLATHAHIWPDYIRIRPLDRAT